VEIFFENFLRGENLKRAEKNLSSADFITVARMVQKTVRQGGGRPWRRRPSA
jgi:hypothetical protein